MRFYSSGSQHAPYLPHIGLTYRPGLTLCQTHTGTQPPEPVHFPFTTCLRGGYHRSVCKDHPPRQRLRGSADAALRTPVSAAQSWRLQTHIFTFAALLVLFVVILYLYLCLIWAFRGMYTGVVYCYPCLVLVGCSTCIEFFFLWWCTVMKTTALNPMPYCVYVLRVSLFFLILSLQNSKASHSQHPSHIHL